MARIEKTVFISYRRTDVYTALAVYENLKNQGYDVFFDYRSISSGDFEQIITGNIRARAHFILILTPTALDRCSEPGDWLRREIELAMDEKRNIVPLFFKRFRFGASSKSGISKWLPFGNPDVLTGKLKDLSRYNGLNVHEDYFEEAMNRLRTEYLNKPLDTVLHPVSIEVRKVVKEEQEAADEALKQKEELKQPAKQVDEKSKPKNKRPEPIIPKLEKKEVKSPAPLKERPWRIVGGIAGIFSFITLIIWGGMILWKNLSSATPEPETKTLTLDIGSTMTGKDGMTLLYIPANEFTMGSEDGTENEKPAHIVNLNAFWIDQTEVTNKMYSLCVGEDECDLPFDSKSNTRLNYYGNPTYDNFPVIFMDWNMAKTYCEWADRRLPTEAEWEKAARGTDGRKYPWGDDDPNSNLLNYNNTERDTTKIGSYPDGASVYEALDMAGNVWEWVSSAYMPYPYDGKDGREDLSIDNLRVVRGGSWDSDGNLVRSSFRGADDPSESLINFGFRCARNASS